MRGLHDARTSAAEHDEATLGEFLAEQHHAAIHLIGARRGMTAHHAYTAPAVVLLEKRLQCHVDAVVVEGSCQRLQHVAAVLARIDEMIIGACVVACCKGCLAARLIARIEFVGRVEGLSRHVVGHLLQVVRQMYLCIEVFY